MKVIYQSYFQQILDFNLTLGIYLKLKIHLYLVKHSVVVSSNCLIIPKQIYHRQLHPFTNCSSMHVTLNLKFYVQTEWTEVKFKVILHVHEKQLVNICNYRWYIHLSSGERWQKGGLNCLYTKYVTRFYSKRTTSVITLE